MKVCIQICRRLLAISSVAWLATLAAVTALAEEPPVAVIRMETTALLEAKVNAGIDPQTIAKEMKLPWPAAAPTKTPQQVEEELRQRLQARNGGGAAVEIDEADLRNRAERKIPLAKPGETVALQLATGGELRGKLESYAEGAVKVGGRTMRTSALSPDSIALLDPQANAAARQEWMQRERIRLMSEQDTTVIGGAQKLRAQLYKAAGYVYWRQTWISPVELLNKAVAYRRQQLTKELRPQVVQEVAARYGFAWKDGNWVPLKADPDPVATATADNAPPPDLPEPNGVATPPAAAPPATSPPTGRRRGPPPPDSVEILFELELQGAPPGPVAVPAPIGIDL